MEQNLNDKTACLVTAFQSGDVSAFSTLGTFIKYYKISQLIHTQSIAN